MNTGTATCWVAGTRHLCANVISRTVVSAALPRFIGIDPRRNRQWARRWPTNCRTHTSSSTSDDDWIVRLDQARLRYPASELVHPALDLVIRPPPPRHRRAQHAPSGAPGGGHALLGTNGAGKSLLIAALTAKRWHGKDEATDDPHVVDASTLLYSQTPPSVASVSFRSHQDLLVAGGSAHRALTSHTGHLTKAALYLTVRLGLYPLLTHDVTTLSTGEIRKLLLIRAVSQRPRLLVLDNALDGLDVPSRNMVNDLVSKIITGFSADLLVQGINVQSVGQSQVVLATHRAEEIVTAIATVTQFHTHARTNDTTTAPSLAETRERNGQSGDELILDAMGWGNLDPPSSAPWDDSSLPNRQAIAELWRSSPTTLGDELVRFGNVTVTKGETSLLSQLDWTVRRGERWLVAGGNGAGKSSLSKLLTLNDIARSFEGMCHVAVTPDAIGWVSTERHLSMSNATQSALDVVLGNDDSSLVSVVSDNVARLIATQWLGLDPSILTRPFDKLSQGEQKLVLIAAALARRPQLLILDEPLQGLDWINRRRILGLVERICQATSMSLVYITHHFEELIPSVTNVLHLKEGRSTFNGPISSYDPNKQ